MSHPSRPGIVAIVALAFVAAALPLASVSAHTCRSVQPVAPADPADPDTGCNGTACPCTGAPHDHRNELPPQSCSKEREGCRRVCVAHEAEAFCLEIGAALP